MVENITLGPPLITANITPFAFRLYAKDFYGAYKSYKPSISFSRAKFYLICMSIELAAKTLHADQGKKYKGLRNLGHCLKRACGKSTLNKYEIGLSKSEIAELAKANKYYKPKGFEYFLFNHPDIDDPNISGPQLALTGYPNLPKLKVLESIANKLLKVPLNNP